MDERPPTSSTAPLPRALPTVAVVTGASRGLGAGLAARFAEHGVRLGLCARTEPTIPDGAHALSRSVDVRDPVALARFADDVTRSIGPIDLWIDNAGVLAPVGPLRDAEVAQLTANIEVNLTGALLGSRTFARLVHDRSSPGVLVNVTSGAARTPYAGWAAYCATKAGVEQLSRVLAVEESSHGLTVFAVAPGVVDTDMQAMIRATPAERFPTVDRFLGLAETGSFNTPAWVADRILDLHASTRGGPVPDWYDPSTDPVVVRVPDEPRS